MITMTKDDRWNRLASLLWFIFTLVSGLSLLAACWLAIFGIIDWLSVLLWWLLFTFVVLVIGSTLAAFAKSFDKKRGI